MVTSGLGGWLFVDDAQVRTQVDESTDFCIKNKTHWGTRKNEQVWKRLPAKVEKQAELHTGRSGQRRADALAIGTVD